MRNKIIGFGLMVVGVGLLVFKIKKPAKYNDSIASDYKGLLGGVGLVVLGFVMLFN